MTLRLAPITEDEIGRTLRLALAHPAISDTDTLLQFHNVERLGALIEHLMALFPENSLHAVAIKANPVVGVLRHVVTAGAGLEAASFEEVHLALAAGCPPERTVFDSPAKTVAELQAALKLGVIVNLDNFDELERVADLIQKNAAPLGIVGLRINPEVGSGAITITSVGNRGSKFGVSLSRDRQRIIAAFQQYFWLTGLHSHVGSQGCTLDHLTEAAANTAMLKSDIERATEQGRIRFVDLGGGLPHRYVDGDPDIAFAELATSLRKAAPGLFDGSVQLATEFGRALQAGCGWSVARIEYVKHDGVAPMLICHAGADLLMRPVYQPDVWRHRFSLYDASGILKGEAPVANTGNWTVAGPLCFGGDIIARGLDLCDPQPGDWLVVHDTGAYTMSLWSRHCSRGMPVVFGYRDSSNDIEVLRQGETPDDIVRFWS